MKDKIIHGDCVVEMKSLSDESVDLIYLDPPFFTQKSHSLSNRQGDKKFEFFDMWQSSSEYAHFIYDRMVEARRILKNTGSIFFHCDRNSVHIARFVLDQVFGEDAFCSEIIWYFRRWSNSQKGLLPSHQNILFYSKSPSFKFNQIMTEYSASTNADQIIQKRARDGRNKSVYARDEEGNVISNGSKKGVPLGDVWEIPYLNPKAKGRVGYPTQKPILLLERIIELVTDEGDIVLDPFCGSGTTLVAAKLMKRHWIGIDTSADAVELTEARLAEPIKTVSNLMQKGRDAYLNVDQTVDAVMFGTDYVRVQRNNGIDCILKEEVLGKAVLVRVQRQGETVAEAAYCLKKAAKNKGVAELFLIVTNPDLDIFSNSKEYGSEIHVIPATWYSIKEKLNQMQSKLPKPQLVSSLAK